MSQLQSNACQFHRKPKRCPAASSTRMPSGTTSFPMPSPAMTAILKVFMYAALYSLSVDNNGDNARTSGAESKALAKAIILSVLTFGQSAYSAHPLNFADVSSKVMG